MEGEEAGVDEQVVHRVDVDLFGDTNRRDQHEEEQQADRRKETHARGQRAGIELLRQADADVLAGDQFVRLPVAVEPVVARLRLHRRQAAVDEIDVGEVGVALVNGHLRF